MAYVSALLALIPLVVAAVWYRRRAQVAPASS